MRSLNTLPYSAVQFALEGRATMNNVIDTQYKPIENSISKIADPDLKAAASHYLSHLKSGILKTQLTLLDEDGNYNPYISIMDINQRPYTVSSFKQAIDTLLEDGEKDELSKFLEEEMPTQKQKSIKINGLTVSNIAVNPLTGKPYTKSNLLTMAKNGALKANMLTVTYPSNNKSFNADIDKEFESVENALLAYTSTDLHDSTHEILNVLKSSLLAKAIIHGKKQDLSSDVEYAIADSLNNALEFKGQQGVGKYYYALTDLEFNINNNDLKIQVNPNLFKRALQGFMKALAKVSSVLNPLHGSIVSAASFFAPKKPAVQPNVANFAKQVANFETSVEKSDLELDSNFNNQSGNEDLAELDKQFLMS